MSERKRVKKMGKLQYERKYVDFTNYELIDRSQSQEVTLMV